MAKKHATICYTPRRIKKSFHYNRRFFQKVKSKETKGASHFVARYFFLLSTTKSLLFFALAMVFFEEKQDLANGKKEDMQHFEMHLETNPSE